MPWVLLAVGVMLALLTLPALIPVHHWALLFPAFFVSWLGTGFAGWWLLVAPIPLAVPAALGGAASWPGWLGLGFGALAIAGLLYQRTLARRAAVSFDRALSALDQRTMGRQRRTPVSVLFPFWMRARAVERVRNLRYAPGAGRRHLLDVYRPSPGVVGAPVLLQIHGGAWMVGTKNTQGRPLMDALTERGWVCVAINYRLSPRAKFPDHLVDCKLALAWIRENIGVHGGDPNRVVVTGGSAGGHLASLVALTANDPRYQPDFETVDTSVVGCVSMYGVYDLEGVFRYGTPLSRRIAGRMGAAVMGVTPAEDVEKYRAASPIDLVRPGVPPFLLVHGSIDNLVPVEQARAISARLAKVGAEVTYVELPGAPHALDVFHSEWADATVAGAVRWLSWLMSRGGERTEDVGTAVTDPRTIAHMAPS
jgi:acetyl esterase/lipase